MKKKTMRMLSAALAVTLLSGCGAAQTNTPAETSVNQAMLLEKSAQPQESAYTFPEKFTGDWTGQEGKLTIHADAQVVAELGTALPTATVEPREFNQEDVDNLLKVFLKGEPLYSHVQTKQELQEHLDYINSPDWTSDPGKPSDPASLEARRKELNAWYTAEIAKAPEEKPILHGFSDSDDPKWIGGTATVDGIKWEVSIRNDIDGGWTAAYIERTDYKYRDYSIQLPDASKEESIARGNALMQALGLQKFVLTDAQQWSCGAAGRQWHLAALLRAYRKWLPYSRCSAGYDPNPRWDGVPGLPVLVLLCQRGNQSGYRILETGKYLSGRGQGRDSVFQLDRSQHPAGGAAGRKHVTSI